jgi:hypothetical protein
MIASSFATGILGRVQEVVRLADALIETQALADLANMAPTFTIRANDLIIAAIGLPLLRALRQDCPQCDIIFAPGSG